MGNRIIGNDPTIASMLSREGSKQNHEPFSPQPFHLLPVSVRQKIQKLKACTHQKYGVYQGLEDQKGGRSQCVVRIVVTIGEGIF